MSSETDGTDQRQICRCNECEKRKETVPQESEVQAQQLPFRSWQMQEPDILSGWEPAEE